LLCVHFVTHSYKSEHYVTDLNGDKCVDIIKSTYKPMSFMPLEYRLSPK